MCLQPITIPNQTRYISLKYSNPYLIDVPCGSCAECQQTISNQWYYRSYFEWDDLSKFDGYVLFDCLTYAPKYLPHLSDFWSYLPTDMDFPCFNRKHLRNFLQNLRIRLIRFGFAKDVFRYFIASEYGTDKSSTHRPHYHLMLFVRDKHIDPLFLSALIAELWKYGRTDGIPYKSRYYVLGHNVIDCSANLFSNRLRTLRYVTKYVQKSCLFQDELDKRISLVMPEIAKQQCPDNPDEWLESELARRERLRLLRCVNQFHRQSQHFGETALAQLDLNQLEKDGCLYMPDSQGVKIPIPLPMYYKRKLCQELVNIDGSRYWVNTSYGDYYCKVCRERNKELVTKRYQSVVDFFKLPIPDVSVLVDYVFEKRGRIKGNLPEGTLFDRYAECDLYNYVTPSDKLQFGCRGLSCFDYGNPQIGYKSYKLRFRVPMSHFISKYCYRDDDMEKQLSLIKSYLSRYNVEKQCAFDDKQRLKELFKPYRL